jgi:hypothetical protein
MMHDRQVVVWKSLGWAFLALAALFAVGEYLDWF